MKKTLALLLCLLLTLGSIGLSAGASADIDEVVVEAMDDDASESEAPVSSDALCADVQVFGVEPAVEAAADSFIGLSAPDEPPLEGAGDDDPDAPSPSNDEPSPATDEPTPDPTEPPAVPTYTFDKSGTSKLLNLGAVLQLKVRGKAIRRCVSAAKTIATVTSAGLVRGRRVGNATITVTLTNGKKLTVTIRVVDPKVPRKVTIAQGARQMLVKGTRFKLTATVTPSTAPQTVSWKSSDKAVAYVTAKGNVIARKPGKVTITATTKNKKTAKTVVVVRSRAFEPYMISHAMGGIDGKQYSNCLEAFLENYEEGHRIFEVDMEYTSDGKLVLWHDWGRQFSSKYPSGYKPTYKQFMNAKIFDKYTPMDVKALIRLMNRYPDVRILTDTKYTGAATVKKQFTTIVKTAKNLGMSAVLDRLVVEIYSQNMLKIVKGIYPFKEYVFTLYKVFRKPPTFAEMRAVARFCKLNGVRTVAMFTYWWKPGYEDVIAPYDVDIALYTTNSKKSMKRYIRQGVTGVFTDRLPPL